jgi:thymidine kinase
VAKLYFYYSTMNAGKSTSLLQSSHNYRERGMRTLVYTAKLDQRGGGKVHSRIGLSSEALHFAPGDRLFHDIEREHRRQSVSCVLLDEAQFLTRAQVDELALVVDRLSIPVLCYGLRTDFRGELFEGSHYLLAWADELQELKTICHTGRKATMVVRVDEQGYALREGSQVEIGGNERYVSVSRKEFKDVFYGGKRIRLIDPLQRPQPDEPEQQKKLLD